MQKNHLKQAEHRRRWGMETKAHSIEKILTSQVKAKGKEQNLGVKEEKKIK